MYFYEIIKYITHPQLRVYLLLCVWHVFVQHTIIIIINVIYHRTAPQELNLLKHKYMCEKWIAVKFKDHSYHIEKLPKRLLEFYVSALPMSELCFCSIEIDKRMFWMLFKTVRFLFSSNCVGFCIMLWWCANIEQKPKNYSIRRDRDIIVGYILYSENFSMYTLILVTQQSTQMITI